MPVITLPDGSQRTFEASVTVMEVAASIGAGLAKATLAGKVNDKLVDASFIITKDSSLKIITEKDPEGLEVIRHSCAHLLAQAVQSVYPDAQVTIGPVIEDGFFYDFSYKTPFTTEDLALFEAKMEELSKKDLTVTRHVLSRADAIAKFEAMNEHYKVQIIKDLPEGEELSCYQQGDFIDLCRGPHVPSTSKIKAFKLTKVAGAYWRGDSKNEMLHRVYGTAWANAKDLKAYLDRIEEAEKRDHRKLAKKFDLFHIQEEAPGSVFWHPNGWTMVRLIREYISKKIDEQDYQQINTPSIVDATLWEKSGHLKMFGKEMFTLEANEKTYAVKPMNCPCHIQVYNQGIKSYRDLPLRLAEFGSCHRNEPSGALHGLMRVRSFVQDDAHIFCTEDQIQSEVAQFIDLVFDVYKDFGFTDVMLKLSTRPPERVGSDEVWDKAEAALSDALNAKGIEWQLLPGEGAFYGPKIEFSLRDCIGRVWQCGTIQVDFSMPVRLESFYIAENGERKNPVMLHRAVFGSLERFLGILIEESAGNFPFWLAPVQVSVITITEKFNPTALEIQQKLKKAGFRTSIDLRNEKIGFKIREHTLLRVPYLIIVGEKEVATNTVSLRTREGEERSGIDINTLVVELNELSARYGRKNLEEQPLGSHQ